MSDEFAGAIVHAYDRYLSWYGQGSGFDPGFWQMEALRRARTEWELAVQDYLRPSGNRRPLVMQRLERGESGAATFVGVEFLRPGSPQRKSIRCHQIGDSVLFHAFACRRDEKVERLPELRWWKSSAALPSVRVDSRGRAVRNKVQLEGVCVAYSVVPEMDCDDFKKVPQYLRVRGDHPLLALYDGSVHTGDLLILATYGLAEWMLRQPNFAVAVSSLLSCTAPGGDWTGAFTKWVDAQYLDEQNWLRKRGNAVIVVRVL